MFELVQAVRGFAKLASLPSIGISLRRVPTGNEVEVSAEDFREYYNGLLPVPFVAS